MIYFKKSQPAPASLADKKSYREADVIERIHDDFKNKCYLCETLAPTSINVEHFIPHRGNDDLKYNWDNLFYACSHCNNTKEMLERDSEFKGGFLNCTHEEDRVDERISYRVYSFPIAIVVIEKAEISDEEYSVRVENTITLLDAIYNGYKTSIKKIEAENIRTAILNEIDTFQNLLIEMVTAKSSAEKDDLIKKVRNCLKNDTAFTAFKRWIVKDNPELKSMIEI